jgi:hypothetical protein
MITYPVSLPAELGFAEMRITPNSAVAMTQSPFTGEQQIFVNPSEFWQGEFSLPENMSRARGAACIGFLLSLNGREGTFLAGDPTGTSPRGSWAGSPKVLGAHAAGVKTIAMDGFTPTQTGVAKSGDWFQIGSGSTTHLHQVVKDADSDAGGLATIEIWPMLRAALADNDTFITASAKGIWRLTVNGVPWTLLPDVRVGGIVIPCIEAL